MAEPQPNAWSVLADLLKALITLSVGLLAVTVTFAGSLARSSTGLIIAWVLLLLTIVLSVLGAYFTVSYLKDNARGGAAIFCANAAFFTLVLASVGLLAAGWTAVRTDRPSALERAAAEAISSLSEIVGSETLWTVRSVEWLPATRRYRTLLDGSSGEFYSVTVSEGGGATSLLRLSRKED